MTSADGLFWTYEQAVSYYKFAVINYIGFHDRGMLFDRRARRWTREYIEQSGFQNQGVAVLRTEWAQLRKNRMISQH